MMRSRGQFGAGCGVGDSLGFKSFQEFGGVESWFNILLPARSTHTAQIWPLPLRVGFAMLASEHPCRAFAVHLWPLGAQAEDGAAGEPEKKKKKKDTANDD